MPSGSLDAGIVVLTASGGKLELLFNLAMSGVQARGRSGETRRSKKARSGKYLRTELFFGFDETFQGSSVRVETAKNRF